MKNLIIALMISLSSVGCTALSGIVGSGVGAFAGTQLDKVTGNTGIFRQVLGGVGFIAAGAIAQYLTEQDKENIEMVLNDPTPTTAAWCSDSKSVSRKVKGVQCGASTNKITLTSGKVSKNNQGQSCRNIKTEADKSSGEDLATTTQKVCLVDGTWRPA